MKGILLVDKPATWTSFDVVNYVRKIVAAVNGTKPKNTKVGHSGTLDPLATGLLVLLVGKEYTTQAAALTKLDKKYSVTMKLGYESTTGDDEGEKKFISNEVPSLEEIEACLVGFSGQIVQTPPIYSAIKVGGVRAYKLAREHKPVVLDPRPATIYRIELTEYKYPYVSLDVMVSSGTYIRSLVSDIGLSLQTGAYIEILCRTQVGNYSLDGALRLDDLNEEKIANSLETHVRER